MILEFELPTPTPSNNALLRMHWSKRGRTQKELAKEMWAITKIKVWTKRPPPVYVKVAIRRIGRRRLDQDNLYGGTKMLIDCLIQCGLIQDDDEKHIDLTVEQEIGRPPRTHVRLETAEEG